MECYEAIHQTIEMTAETSHIVDTGQTDVVMMVYEEQSDIPNDGVARWSSDATRYLILLRKEMDDTFRNPPCRLKKLWERLSVKMAEQNHVHNNEACRKKWGNLLRVYRKIRDNPSSERPRETWEFYALMKDACGDRTGTIPSSSSSILCVSSGNPACDSDDGLGRDTTSSPQLSASDESAPKIIRKRKGPPEWFTKYIAKRDKERAAENEERNNLEREKIETMKSVRDLLQALLNK